MSHPHALDLSLDDLLRLAADEDRTELDVTSRSLAAFAAAQGREIGDTAFGIRAKSPGVFAGRAWLERVAARAGWTLSFARSDGEELVAGDLVTSGTAPWEGLLGFERLGLNLLQHLSGVASATRALVREVDEAWRAHPERERFAAPGVYHTRKTLPLLRDEQIAAVLAGGGRAHRRDLSQRLLAKDNHKELLAQAGLSYADWVRFVIEEQGLGDSLFEADSADEALALAAAGARHLLLDNFEPEAVSRLLPRLPEAVEIEISGGLAAGRLAPYVRPGVHRLSVGSLTHSVRALDLSLELA